MQRPKTKVLKHDRDNLDHKLPAAWSQSERSRNRVCYGCNDIFTLSTATDEFNFCSERCERYYAANENRRNR